MNIKTLLLASCWLLVGWLQAQNRELYQRELNPYGSLGMVEAKIVHIADSSFLIIYSPARDYAATVRIYQEYEQKKLISEQFLNLNAQSIQQERAKIYLPVPSQSKLCAVEIQINGSGFSYYDILLLNRAQETEQSFILSQQGAIQTNRRVKSGESYQIQHREGQISRFYIKYFPDNSPAARAAYIEEKEDFNPLKNQQELIVVEKNQPFSFEKEGLYFIQSDSSSNKGAFYFCQNGDYPKLSKIGELIASARYICTNKEYEQINRATDKKAEFDRFWLARHRDKERARQLLKSYYQRVEAANRFFTVQKQGWKTDRGLIYIVFGQPQVVRKFAGKEVWFYKSSGLRQPIEFVFDRVGELYWLQRDRVYRPAWEEEVQRWRKAKQQ